MIEQQVHHIHDASLDCYLKWCPSIFAFSVWIDSPMQKDKLLNFLLNRCLRLIKTVTSVLIMQVEKARFQILMTRIPKTIWQLTN